MKTNKIVKDLNLLRRNPRALDRGRMFAEDISALGKQPRPLGRGGPLSKDILKLPDINQAYLAHKILFEYMEINGLQGLNIT